MTDPTIIEEFKQAFEFFDTDRDGYLTGCEVFSLFRGLNIPVKSFDIQQLMSLNHSKKVQKKKKVSSHVSTLIKNHAGVVESQYKISFDELLSFATHQLIDNNENVLRNTFELFLERNNDEEITLSNLKRIVKETALEKQFTDDVLLELVHEINNRVPKNNMTSKNTINFTQFRSAMMADEMDFNYEEAREDFSVFTSDFLLSSGSSTDP